MSEEADESPILVCMPADSPYAVPSSDFSKSCYKCGTRLMVAPTGIKFLKENPSTRISCIQCAVPEITAKDAEHRLAAPADEITRELRSAEPNIFRRRN